MGRSCQQFGSEAGEPRRSAKEHETSSRQRVSDPAQIGGCSCFLFSLDDVLKHIHEADMRCMAECQYDAFDLCF